MSYLHFMIKGVNSIPKEFTLGYYPEPEITDLTQDVIEVKEQDSATKIFEVNNAFKIKTLSDEVLKKSTNKWATLQKSCKIIARITLIGGLAALITAVTLGLLSSSLLLPAIAIGIVALALFTFSGVSNKRSNQAEKELNKWKTLERGKIKECEKRHDWQIAIQAMQSDLERVINNEATSLKKLEKEEHKSDQLQNFTRTLFHLWGTHSVDCMQKYGEGISKEKFIEILDLYKPQYPFLNEVTLMPVS